MKKKNVLFLLATVCMLGSMHPMTMLNVNAQETVAEEQAPDILQSDEETFVENGFVYIVDEEGNAIITDFTGSVEGGFTVPVTLGGYNVAAIGERAFEGNLDITWLVIPENITTIHNYAFLGCTNLKAIQLSKELKELGQSAFGECDALESVEIPKSLETVYTYGLTTSYGAFYGCDNLKTITFEEGTTQICAQLFRNCPGIESVVIPESIIKIGEGAFAACANLQSVQMPDSITVIENYAFSNCAKLTDAKLSKGLKELGQSAFGECDALTGVEIPKKLDTVYTYGLTTHYGAFYGCDNLKEITFEEGSIRIPAHLFRNCPGIESISLPETIYMIEEGAFTNCTNLQTVQMTDNVNSIGKDAFYGCTKLNDVKLSKGLTEIGNAAFGECDALTSVKIPKKLETVHVFGLSNNYGVFNGCDNLKEVTFEEGTTQICANLLHNCNGIENIEIPNTVTTIGERAFQNCAGLQAITVPEQVLSLGNYVFADCTGLTNVSIGSGIRTLPNSAFSNCTALQKVVLPYRVTTVNKNAFSGCTQLTEIVIPRKTSSIERDVFSNPTALTIYGVSGTYAEEYAATIGATFVNKAVEAAALSLPATEMTLDVEDTALLLTSFAPADFTNEVIFSSDNTDVATVSDLGVITAVGVGSTQIRVSAGNVSAACALTVNYGFQCADIMKDSWKYVPAKYVYNLGIMTGKGNTNEGKIVFAPDESLTREQLAAMLYKYAEYKGYNIYARADLEAYTDAADISSWATNQLSWAVANKIMSGKGDGLDPKGAATRAECATMIRAFMVKFAE